MTTKGEGKKIKRFLFWFWAAAALACMAAIFFFSSETAEQSGGTSSSLTKSLFGFSDEKTGEPKEENRTVFIEKMGMIVRKSAHFLIFFVLGFCTANTIKGITDNKRRLFWIPFAWCVLYAITDEIHQYFVPGRSCMWQDCVLDAAGSAAGIGAAFFIFMIINHKKGKGGKTGG